jgi:hypothetical protein
MPMQLKPGLRLRSTTCTAEVIVVKGSGEVDLRCGGEPLGDMSAAAGPAAAPGTEMLTAMGKRYANDDIELLCTKPGAGQLSIGDVALEVKGAKALPASD